MSAAILHVETRHRRGGAERNVNHFTVWQAAAGYRVGLAVGRDSELEEVPATVEPILVPSLVRRVDPVQDLLAVRHLRHLVGRSGFDVVHTHQSKAGIVGRVAARGRAGLVLHTVHMLSFGPGYGRMPSAGFLRAERVCAGWTDELIAVGEELRERYLAVGVGSPDRFRVIHSPIDLEAFEAVRAWSTGEREAAREALGVPAGSPLVLVVSALEPRKRVGLIIDRLAERIRQGWYLVVAGDGRLLAGLQRQVTGQRLSDRIQFLGQRDDIPSLMAAANVLVHAAESEGVPQAVIQSLAAGLPIVATDVIGLREVLGAPVLVAETDGHDLAALVGRAVQSPPTMVAPKALSPWRAVAVETEIARLHADLGLRS